MDLWTEINQIKAKTKWQKCDIEILIFYIQHLTEMNNKIAGDLGEALQALDSARRRIEFYRAATLPQSVGSIK